MKWEGGEESSNVEDRRGLSGTHVAMGGGGVVVLLIAYFLGINPSQLGQIFGNSTSSSGERAAGVPW